MKPILGLLVGLLLVACTSTPPTRIADPHLASLSSSARAAFDRGDYARADRLYTEAMGRGRRLDLSAALSDLAYNLAAVRIAQRQTSEVAALLAECRSERLRSGKPTADVDLLEIRWKLLIRDLDGARADLGRLSRDQTTPADRAPLLLLTALVESEAGQTDALEQALRALGPSEDPLAQHLHGVLHLQRMQYAEAAQRFEQSAAAYRDQGRAAEMSSAWARAGDAWKRGGSLVQSSECFYRAARSAQAQNDRVQGLRWIQAALDAVPADADAGLRTRLQQLAKSLTDLPVPAETGPH